MATNWTIDTNTKLACKFEETTGNVIDSSTYGNNGTKTGSWTQGVAGKYGNALKAPGGNSNAYINFGSAVSLDNLANISICAWLYNTSFGQTDGLYTDRGAIINKNGRSWCLGFQTINQIRYLEHFSGGTTNATTTGGNCVTGAWQHYAVTRNRSGTAAPLIYIDGVSQAVSGWAPSGTKDDDSAGNLYYGQNDTSNVGEIDSTSDELMIYQGILTATDINGIKDNGIDGAQGTQPAKNAVLFGCNF